MCRQLLVSSSEDEHSKHWKKVQCVGLLAVCFEKAYSSATEMMPEIMPEVFRWPYDQHPGKSISV